MIWRDHVLNFVFLILMFVIFVLKFLILVFKFVILVLKLVILILKFAIAKQSSATLSLHWWTNPTSQIEFSPGKFEWCPTWWDLRFEITQRSNFQNYNTSCSGDNLPCPNLSYSPLCYGSPFLETGADRSPWLDLAQLHFFNFLVNNLVQIFLLVLKITFSASVVAACRQSSAKTICYAEWSHRWIGLYIDMLIWQHILS